MNRIQTSLFAALSIVSFAPVALANDDGTDLAVDDADDEAAEDEAQDVVDEGDYCGGDEDYPLMDAEGYLEGREWRPLYREVSAMLRQGRAGWQRATALSYLATAELHIGKARPAARNFRLAFALDADSVSPALHAEHAVALLRNRQRDAAFDEAATFVADQCAAPETWIQAACWAAHTVMARATDDATVRDEHLRAAETIRPNRDELLADVADFEHLLDGTAPATRVASR